MLRKKIMLIEAIAYTICIRYVYVYVMYKSDKRILISKRVEDILFEGIACKQHSI